MPKHRSIRDLQELPLGPVDLEGIVTFVDLANGRFWMQDDSGAIAITDDLGKDRIDVGQEVLLRANKTHPFDSSVGLQSVGLSALKVAVIKTHASLPQETSATVNTLSDKDKNGIRVTVEGVLHYISQRPDQREILYLGASNQEIEAIVPAGGQDFRQWINLTVRVTGVAEIVLDPGGSIRSRLVWVLGTHDVQQIEGGIMPPQLYSVRTLYQLSKSDSGHRILLRGRVAAQSGTLVLLQDEWGIVSCESDVPVSLPHGAGVEVAGFPVRNGIRIDLVHSHFRKTRHLPPSNEHSVSPLTSISSVRRLTEQQSESAMPVKLKGVVTFNDSDWQQLFLQDATGGIFVKYAGHPSIARGEIVTLVGLTNSGDYAPIIVASEFINHRPGSLPKAVAMTEKAWTGVMDGLFVEVEGIVHPVMHRQHPKHPTFDIYTSFGQVHVTAGPDFGSLTYLRKLEDDRVRIRGVGSVVFNLRRQLIGLQVVISSPKDIRIVNAGLDDPFHGSSVAIDSLLRFSPSARFGHRAKVSGTVTMLGRGFFYVQDSTAGARVEADTSGLHVADLVNVAGYPSPDGYSPILTDAVVRVIRGGEPAPVQEVTPETIGDGRFDSELVSIKGTLVGVVNSPEAITLVLRSDGRTLDAVLYPLNSDDNVSIPREGSLLRLTGICSVPVKDSSIYMLLTKARVGVKIIVRSPRDIMVLQPTSWWKTERAVVIAIGLFVAVCASLTWIAFLRRRVDKQRTALEQARDKDAAISDFIRVMQDVTRNKRFTSQVPVQGTDEIALLSTEFNHMLAELHLSDIAKSEAESKLQHQALTDELTGLPNRRLLSDRLSQVLEMAKRDSRIVALLYVDLDGFKLVNDSLGHTVGDCLLAEVAQRLGSRIRKSDTLARLGGDEFTVVLTRLNAKEEAALVAKSLLDVLSRPFLIEHHEITIGASVGVSLFPDNAMDASELLQQADSAMYSAKRNGKNRIMYFTSELGLSVRERLNLENQLRGAIARKEIAVHYQPEFDIATRRLVRFEALARWQHPTLGNITPDRFIPIAEESGLIIPIGTFILETACREAVTWQSLSEEPIQVAVNVSTVQFRKETFVDEVAIILRDTGLDPKLLQLELTESIMLDGTERASNTMKRLAAMGISIAVDDFGTGYSCFSYLPRLPFNTLKIDRTFVNELGKRAEMAAMIRSLVTLAHDLNMQVVVEGIETKQQLEAIEMLGGNQVQGYLLGRPTLDPKALLISSQAPASPTNKNSENKESALAKKAAV